MAQNRPEHKRFFVCHLNVTLAYYDGWDRIAEWSGTSLSKVYLWGLDLSGTAQGADGVGGLLSMLDVGTSVRYYPTYGGNGNVSEFINSNLSGASMLAAHFEYDPFGNLTAHTKCDALGSLIAGTAADAANLAYRFSTKPQDPVTGMLYYGYRWYDPLTGRWPSRDLIGEDGGINLYEFVGNDGGTKWDYLGAFVLEQLIGWECKCEMQGTCLDLGHPPPVCFGCDGPVVGVGIGYGKSKRVAISYAIKQAGTNGQHACMKRANAGCGVRWNFGEDAKKCHCSIVLKLIYFPRTTPWDWINVPGPLRDQIPDWFPEKETSPLNPNKLPPVPKGLVPPMPALPPPPPPPPGPIV